MSDLTPESVRALLEAAYLPGRATIHRVTRDDGEIDYEVWRGSDLVLIVDELLTPRTRGDARLYAAAPDLAHALLEAWEERDELTLRSAQLTQAMSLVDSVMVNLSGGNDVAPEKDPMEWAKRVRDAARAMRLRAEGGGEA